MELVKVAWVLNFFLFSFILLFIWSKLYVITRKVEALSSLIKKSSSLSGEYKANMTVKETPEK